MTELPDDLILDTLADFRLVQVGAPNDVYASIGEAMHAARRKPFPTTLYVLTDGQVTITPEQQARLIAKWRERKPH